MKAGILALLLVPASLAAQQPAAAPAPPGSLAGSVLIAATSEPLEGAVVILEPAADAALVAPAGPAWVRRGMSVITGGDGAYRFTDLPPGDYHLVVRHLGFRPAAVDVSLGASAPLRVSVALVMTPIRLESMDVRSLAAEPYGRTRDIARESREGKLDADRYRQERELESDATVLTHQDVIEGVTLGETDLLRGLQHLPGVSARDDFTAGIWTRGAPWSQTRVVMDGLPMFNPVHAIGVFSGVDPDAIGAAVFLPGARSASLGEGGAGVLELSTRRAARPGFSGTGELSVVSARGSMDWGSAGGRTGLVVTARRSYIDLASRIADALTGDTAGYIPYAFEDGTFRFDTDLGRGVGLTASGVLEDDAVRGTVPDLLLRTRGQWGNRAARVTMTVPWGGLALRSTIGASGFDGRLDPFASTVSGTAPVHGLTRNSVDVLLAGVEVAPAAFDPRRSWAGGLQVQLQRQHFLGQYPRPYPVQVLLDTLKLDARLPVAALWGERRIPLGSDAVVEAGLRAEGHRAVLGAPALGLAPRILARVRPRGGAVAFSVGLSRSWQYTQSLAPAGPGIGPDLYVTDVWLLAGDTLPALRSDVATAGAELLLPGGWLATANVYARHETGVAVPDPDSGTVSAARPVEVSATGNAAGLELSVRRLVGRVSASLSFSLARSLLHANGLTFPSPADRRRTLDATVMARVHDALRLGAALTAASGAPFTRFILGCDTAPCADTIALAVEAPNAQRAPGYASLAVLLDWSRTTRHFDLGAYLQVRNVWNASDAVTYTGTVEYCAMPDPPTLVPVTNGPHQYGCDQFHRGVGLLPLAGVRVGF